MKKSILTVSLLLFFIVGCEENGVQQEAHNEKESAELANLQIQLDELKDQITEMQISIETQNNQNKEFKDELLLANEQTQQLINHLPEIESKLGYIEQVNHTNSETTLRVQLIEIQEDSSMPNNYSKKNLAVETITLSNDCLIYVLDNMYPVKLAAINELDEKVKKYKHLFKYTLINNRAILISEVYLP